MFLLRKLPLKLAIVLTLIAVGNPTCYADATKQNSLRLGYHMRRSCTLDLQNNQRLSQFPQRLNLKPAASSSQFFRMTALTTQLMLCMQQALIKVMRLIITLPTQMLGLFGQRPLKA